MRGALHGILWGLVVAIVLTLILAPIARYAPFLLTSALLRVAFAFLITWLLFSVVHEAAGMAGPLTTAIVICLSLVVMLSHHVVWAIWGVPGVEGTVIGWSTWFHPVVLFVHSVFWGIGMIGCWALCRRGVPGADLFSHVLTLHLRGSRRE